MQLIIHTQKFISNLTIWPFRLNFFLFFPLSLSPVLQFQSDYFLQLYIKYNLNLIINKIRKKRSCNFPLTYCAYSNAVTFMREQTIKHKQALAFILVQGPWTKTYKKIKLLVNYWVIIWVFTDTNCTDIGFQILWYC